MNKDETKLKSFGTWNEGKISEGKHVDAEGHERRHYIIQNLVGNAGWETGTIPIEEDKETILSFEVKCIGAGGHEVPPPRDDLEREEFEVWDRKDPGAPLFQLMWHHFMDFIGVELRWLTKDGALMKSRRVRMNVEPHEQLIGHNGLEAMMAMRKDYTRDWTSVWLRETPPKGACSLQVRLIIESRARNGGGLAFRGISVKPVAAATTPPAPGMFRLIVETLDPESGKRIPARIAIVPMSHPGVLKPEEKACIPPGVYHGSNPNGMEFLYSLSGELELELPVGGQHVEALSGLCRELGVAFVEYAKSGETERVKLEMPLAIDMRGKGWISGDHHLHLSGHSRKNYPLMDAQEALKLGAADNLNYLPFQAPIFMARKKNPELHFGATRGRIAAEVVSLIWGHYCAIPGDGPLENVPTDFLRLFPTMLDFVRGLNAQGGACVAAHPFQLICQPLNSICSYSDFPGALTVPGRYNCARELPLILLHGEPCAIDMIVAGGPDQQQIYNREYYKFLDMGFMTGACGSSDTGLDSGSASTCRTFVHAPGGTFKDVAKAYREARTFATNGPVIAVTANGAGPGDFLKVREDETIDIKLEAFSPWGLSFIEAVLNGQPVETRAIPFLKHVKSSFQVKVGKRPGWLAFRVRGPESKWVTTPTFPPGPEHSVCGQFAHTSPIRLAFKDRPFMPTAQATRHFLRWMDSLDAITALYRPRLAKDAEAAGLSEKDAWDILTGRIAQARNKIGRLGKEGWTENS